MLPRRLRGDSDDRQDSGSKCCETPYQSVRAGSNPRGDTVAPPQLPRNAPVLNVVQPPEPRVPGQGQHNEGTAVRMTRDAQSGTHGVAQAYACSCGPLRQTVPRTQAATITGRPQRNALVKGRDEAQRAVADSVGGALGHARTADPPLRLQQRLNDVVGARAQAQAHGVRLLASEQALA